MLTDSPLSASPLSSPLALPGGGGGGGAVAVFSVAGVVGEASYPASAVDFTGSISLDVTATFDTASGAGDPGITRLVTRGGGADYVLAYDFLAGAWVAKDTFGQLASYPSPVVAGQSYRVRVVFDTATNQRRWSVDGVPLNFNFSGGHHGSGSDIYIRGGFGSVNNGVVSTMDVDIYNVAQSDAWLSA